MMLMTRNTAYNIFMLLEKSQTEKYEICTLLNLLEFFQKHS